MNPVREIAIRDDSIRLGQLLKLANVVESGADAKDLLASQKVRVNGTVEMRRGRLIHLGDEVAFGNNELRVVSSSHTVTGTRDPRRPVARARTE